MADFARDLAAPQIGAIEAATSFRVSCLRARSVHERLVVYLDTLR